MFTIRERPVKSYGFVALDPSVVWSNTMGSVMCVTRSGEGAIRAQTMAIEVAEDRGDLVVFLYVAGSSFLNKLAAAVVVDIKGLLESMGRFPLLTAFERASNVISEIGATTLIIGHLTGDPSCLERVEMDTVLISMKE